MTTDSTELEERTSVGEKIKNAAKWVAWLPVKIVLYPVFYVLAKQWARNEYYNHGHGAEDADKEDAD